MAVEKAFLGITNFELIELINSLVNEVNGVPTTYLPLAGGTLTGKVIMHATSNADSASFIWGTVGANKNTPYLGFASDQADGTFLWSLQGTEYKTGLAIGGNSGNLLWKGEKVATTNEIPTISVTQTATSGAKVGSIKINGISTDLYAPNELPQVTTADNGKFLVVEGGKWSKKALAQFYGNADDVTVVNEG